MRGEGIRFWLPVAFASVFALYTSQKLLRTHFNEEIAEPNYEFEREVPACRGSIFDSTGRVSPLVKSVPC